MPAPAQVDPVTQVKGLRILAVALVFAGLLSGVALPALCLKLGITVYMTPWGIDVLWLGGLAVLVSDFGLAWYFRRRAGAIERIMLGLPLRP